MRLLAAAALMLGVGWLLGFAVAQHMRIQQTFRQHGVEPPDIFRRVGAA